jgi:hypothetical protein
MSPATIPNKSQHKNLYLPYTPGFPHGIFVRSGNVTLTPGQQRPLLTTCSPPVSAVILP